MTWTSKSVYVDCNLRRSWILRHNQRWKISKSFLSCWLRMPLRNGSRWRVHIYLNKMMRLCLKTNGMERWMTWPKKATNVPNLYLFFERLPKDRVKEQYPFFYSRTGDDMFFFRFLFFKVDLLTCIIMKQIISYIYQLFVPVELAPAGNNLSLSWRIGSYLSSTHWFHPYYLSLVQVWWDVCHR